MSEQDWTPAFEGQRPPFEQGHDLSTKHGAYADLQLGPRVDELVHEYTTLVPAYRPSDQVMVRLLAVSLARIERAMLALEHAAAGDLGRLESDLRGWVNTSRRIASDLAMSPTARARLGVDVAVVERMWHTVTTLPATDAEAAELEGGAA